MTRPSVLVGISMHPNAQQRLRTEAEVDFRRWDTPLESLRPGIATYDGMLVYVPRLDEATLHAAAKLKAIACHSCPPEVHAAAKERGIRVTVTPNLHDTVADLTQALIFAADPLPPDDPLLTLDNVVLTAHLGGSTKEFDMALVEDTLRVLRGEAPLHPLGHEAR